VIFEAGFLTFEDAADAGVDAALQPDAKQPAVSWWDHMHPTVADAPAADREGASLAATLQQVR
jgi:hypothetical protein